MKVTIELNITDYLLARDRFYEATEKAKLEIDKNKFIHWKAENEEQQKILDLLQEKFELEKTELVDDLLNQLMELNVLLKFNVMKILK